MHYQLFLLILTQLYEKNNTSLEVDDRKLFIYKEEKGWFLSTLIFQGKEIPREFQSLSHFYWQQKGAFIKLDISTSSVYLVQEISLMKYSILKVLVVDFLKQADEWNSLLESVCSQ